MIVASGGHNSWSQQLARKGTKKEEEEGVLLLTLPETEICKTKTSRNANKQKLAKRPAF